MEWEEGTYTSKEGGIGEGGEGGRDEKEEGSGRKERRVHQGLVNTPMYVPNPEKIPC